MKHIYGPVNSRRLGWSLGVDPIPLKTCNWNCVYCQLGRSRPLTNERKIYHPLEEIIHEIDQVLDVHQAGKIDWITIVGSGEPTLHSELGLIIKEIKQRTDIPLAVITNGSLLHLPVVRENLGMADAVLPSLDAGDADLYRKINRPHPEIPYNQLLEGLIAFRREYGGRLWVEVMLVEHLNTSENSLEELSTVLQKVNPDEIHINIPSRPPAETWVEVPQEASIRRAISILGTKARVLCPVQGKYGSGGPKDEIDELIGIISRHPLSEDELSVFLRHWSPGKVGQALKEIEQSGFAQKVVRNGEVFWVADEAYFP